MKDVAAQVYERLLILRCQAGDAAALGELIARYSPGVRFYLRKMAGQAAADDLLQEVWVDVYRKINGLKRVDAFGAWVYRIARDRAYRELRRRGVGRVWVDQEVVEGVVEEQEDGFSEEEAAGVRAALDGLPVEQREVLLLRFVEGMGYEEIAEVIGTAVGTVRSRIFYGKRALRMKLEVGNRKELR